MASAGVVTAFLIYALLSNFLRPVDINPLQNIYANNADLLHQQTNQNHGNFGHGKHTRAVSLILPSLYNRLKKNTKPPTRLQQSNALFITICLLLSGDIHPCPGPNHAEANITADGTLNTTFPRSNVRLTPGVGRAAEVEAAGCGLSGAALFGVDRQRRTTVRGEGDAAVPPHDTQNNTFSGCNTPRAFGNINSPNVNRKQVNPAIRKNRNRNFFQTVNNSRTVWDPKAKPSGLLGGHLKIKSIKSKSEEVHHILMDSNLDFLCLSETWLHESAPTAAFHIPGFNIYRRDRRGSKGGGVMIYVKDSIPCTEIQWSNCKGLETIGVNIALSPQM